MCDYRVTAIFLTIHSCPDTTSTIRMPSPKPCTGITLRPRYSPTSVPAAEYTRQISYSPSMVMPLSFEYLMPMLLSASSVLYTCAFRHKERHVGQGVVAAVRLLSEIESVGSTVKTGVEKRIAQRKFSLEVCRSHGFAVVAGEYTEVAAGIMERRVEQKATVLLAGLISIRPSYTGVRSSSSIITLS